MFSGIIEAIGIVRKISETGSGFDIFIESDISDELKIDQSVAHDGVCLTVVEIQSKLHKVTAIKETLEISNLNTLKEGDHLNLERSIRLSDRLDGHIVQGHVDATASLISITDLDGSWTFRFNIPDGGKSLLVYKGSICINGISLTISALEDEHFEVSIIPYTYEHTNLSFLSAGDLVNVEYDLVGKYILRNLNLK